MSFVKRYWFSGFIGLVLMCFVFVFVLILLAPKQDLKGRGFIPCTEEMVEDLLNCNKGMWCSIKTIVKNNVCALGVIGEGVSRWMKGKQPAPWSNYIFEPELYPEGLVDEEARKAYLAEYPDTKDEMERLHHLRKDMENENNKEIESEKDRQQEE